MNEDETTGGTEAAEVDSTLEEGAQLATAIVFSATAEVIPGGAK